MSHEDDWRWSRDTVGAPDALAMLQNGWNGVKVALVDTGVRVHAALGPWVQVAEGHNFMDPAQPPRPVPPRGMMRHPAHGTRVCSVLCGEERDAVDGVVYQGVAPGLPVIPYCVCDDVLLDSAEEQRRVGAAIMDAMAKGCQVVSISLGFPTVRRHGPLGKAVDAAYAAGVIVCAAGGQVWGTPCYPAKYYRAIAVGGFVGRRDGGREMYWSYGNLNGFIDAWAPAERVLRADGTFDEAPGAAGLYGWGDGTSFATPHVSAAAAMWLAHHGETALADAYPEAWQRVEAFRLLLKRESDDLSGFEGFAKVRPARPGQRPPSKGNEDGEAATGGELNIPALLKAPLPAAAELRQASEAVRQSY